MSFHPADSPHLFSFSDGPTLEHEKVLQSRGLVVCGCDEAGRGPLAGPVTAAAVVLNPACIPDGLNDSKKLTKAKRERLFDEIVAHHHVACISLNAAIIDELNIRSASLTAMALAVEALPVTVDHVLIDGNAVPEPLMGRADALVKGDARSLSIAAASIVAKVTRDRQMERADKIYPGFGFGGHKGYPTAQHRELVAKIGPCPIHRKSFAPVREAIAAITQKST